ncbi:hypothetical protein NX059_010443 [Plenodomus lindquistii]|nr:hypothetical protein NX059_010443 [Plenodomus lindquistii]
MGQMYTTRSTICMPSTVPVAHLYPSVSHVTSLRAFSTASQSSATAEQGQDETAAEAGEETVGGIATESTVEVGPSEAPNMDDGGDALLLKAIEFVRQRKRVSDPRYDEYWSMVVKHQLFSAEASSEEQATAVNTLHSIEAALGIDDVDKRVTGAKHARRMYAVRNHMAALEKIQERERISKSRQDAFSGLLTEIATPPSMLAAIEDLEKNIDGLSRKIFAENAKYAPSSPVSHTRVLSFINQVGRPETGPYAHALQDRLQARLQLMREYFPGLSPSSRVNGFLDILAQTLYTAEYLFSPNGPHHSSENMQDWLSLREALIKECQEALASREKVKYHFHQARERIEQQLEAVIQSNKEGTVETLEGPVEDSREKMPDAVKAEIVELRRILSEYKAELSILKARMFEQSLQYRNIMKQKQALQAKKREMQKQLEAQDKSAQDAQFALRPKKLKKAALTGLDEILDNALNKAPRSEGLPMSGGGSRDEGKGPLLGVDAAEDINRKPPGGTPGTPRNPPSEVQTSKAVTRDANASKRARTGPNSERPQKPTPAPSSVAEALSSMTPTERGSSSDLRLRIPASQQIPIDDNFTVDLTAQVPSLQTQVYEMQQRLRASYPRIDTLPYEVWTSKNKRTLLTWLKILVSRWQSRFDDVGRKGAEAVDEHVEAVLDQMVRDHDLSNEAAERMAMHWHEVVTNRGAMDGDAEGVLDWEEFENGGFGFMAVEEESAEIEGSVEDAAGVTKEEYGKAPPYTSNGHGGFGGITKRLYSTSVRPPRMGTNAETEDADSNTESQSFTSSTTTQPASSAQPYGTHLPHLTSTGTAHMVSVTSKPDTHRTAIAVGTVYFSNPTPLTLIRSASLKKGDVLSVSRIAGIMAAKKCPDIVPLCHPIALTSVGVELDVFGSEPGKHSEHSGNSSGEAGMGYGGITIQAKVACTGPTGVEMEALTAVMGAALSVVDMCKAVDKAQRIEGVRVVLKEGGRSGVWKEEGWAG